MGLKIKKLKSQKAHAQETKTKKTYEAPYNWRYQSSGLTSHLHVPSTSQPQATQGCLCSWAALCMCAHVCVRKRDRQGRKQMIQECLKANGLSEENLPEFSGFKKPCSRCVRGNPSGLQPLASSLPISTSLPAFLLGEILSPP